MKRSHWFGSLALVALLSLSDAAASSERRTRLDSDDCSRQAEACERQCEGRKGMEQLSCKTDCRLAETQCRNGTRR